MILGEGCIPIRGGNIIVETRVCGQIQEAAGYQPCSMKKKKSVCAIIIFLIELRV